MHGKQKRDRGEKKKEANIYVTKVPEGKQNRAEVIFEKIMVENFPNWMTVMKHRFKKHWEPQAV